MAATYSIRRAERHDMQAVLDLIRELAEFEREATAVEITVSDLERDGFSGQPLFFCLVAESAEKIVGMALYYFRYSTWKGKTIHLEDLIVTETHRGKGMGDQLLGSVIAEGKKLGVRRIEWNVLDWNLSACEFYKRRGAKILADWRVVHLDEKGIMGFNVSDMTQNL